MNRTLKVSLILFLLMALLPLASQAAPLSKLSWRAEYYNNVALEGSPVSIRFEDQLNHDWGNGSPGADIQSNNFSARWTQTRHFERGTYLFLLTVDDGARVWLDGELIIDAWSVGRKSKQQARIFIDQAGDHQLQVAYFERSGEAEINLEWVVLGQGNEIVGAWQGEYFSNRTLSGSPDVTRDDGAINFDWNSGSPDFRITRDNFSVRWTRSIYLKAGDYQMRLQHDDGMRVYVDDNNVYDSWKDQRVSYQTKTITLSEGMHAFRVEFYDHLGNAVVHFSMDNDPGNHTGNGDDNNDGGSSPAPGSIVIDNKSSDFHWGGPRNHRHASNGGHGTGFFWTYNTHSNPVNYGKWKPSNLAAGEYQVWVYIPATNATTTKARYRIWHDGTRTDKFVNQSRHSKVWVNLGTYDFSSNGKEGVLLYDNTNEAEGSTKIAFDAVKFVKK